MTHKNPQRSKASKQSARQPSRNPDQPIRKPAAKFVPAADVSSENLTAEANLAGQPNLGQPTENLSAENSSTNEKTPCVEESSTVSSSQVEATGTAPDANTTESEVGTSTPAQTGDRTMAELIFTRSDKQRKSISVVYTASGYPGSVRFSKTLFADKNAPLSVTVASDAFAGPRVKLTAEERKARLKARPKLTDAQKLEKIEQRAARLREKLNAKPADKSAAA